jgi:hypothetical protein
MTENGTLRKRNKEERKGEREKVTNEVSRTYTRNKRMLYNLIGFTWWWTQLVC